uniref:CAP-Gly domain-containing protein n=1 Tax=Pavo cristatus TaxID=9049 RepID=A0A8C9G4Y9_PAVCR
LSVFLQDAVSSKTEGSVKVQPGTLRFKGVTKFARGFWAGVELDKPEGNNNGTYDGIKYFDCKEKHGIFAPPQKISHITESIDSLVDACEYEDSFFDDRLEKKHKDEQKDKGTSKTSKEDDSQSRGATETCSQDKAAADTAVSEASAGKSVDELLPSVFILKKSKYSRLNHLVKELVAIEIIKLSDCSICRTNIS